MSDGGKTVDGLEYNSKGYLMSPKPDKSKWSLVAMMLAVIAPFAITWGKWSVPFSSMVIYRLGLFQVLADQNLITGDQIAKTEILLMLILLMEMIGIRSFFSKYCCKYTDENPPPEPLRKLWPKQIWLTLKVSGAIFMTPVVVGSGVYWGSIKEFFSPSLVILSLFCVSCGLLLTSEALISGALYSYFYFRYWRSSKQPSDLTS